MIKNQAYVLILFMFWIVASSWFYVAEIKEVYPNHFSHSKTKHPIFFKYSDSEVQLGNEYSSFKDFTLEKLELTNRLLIIGNYTSDEHNNTSHPNLGIARAINASKLFQNLEKSQIQMVSQLKDSMYNLKFKKSKWLDAIDFRVLTNNSFLEESVEGAKLYLNQDLYHPKIQAYLKYIAIENLDNQFSLMEITNLSSDSIPIKSIFIKDQLLSNGIDSSQISILPMLLDTTQNPYLEIYINKSQSNEY